MPNDLLDVPEAKTWFDRLTALNRLGICPPFELEIRESPKIYAVVAVCSSPHRATVLGDFLDKSNAGLDVQLAQRVVESATYHTVELVFDRK